MGDDKGFTKTDMERIGIFKEMGYISIKDPYKAKASSKFNKKCAILYASRLGIAGF